MTWQGRARAERLPPNWPTVRRHTLDRDPICTCHGCPRCTDTGCPRASTDADHILPIDDHTPTNLAGKCSPCHAWKSSREGVQARGYGALRRRTAENHPGLRGGGRP